MPIAPLPGPKGLFKVSAQPRFLLDSNGVGWQGAFFADLVGAPSGTVDHGHQRFCLQRTLQSAQCRRIGGESWDVMPAGIAVWHAGDEQRVQWRGAGRAQFLFVEPAHVECMLERVPARMAGDSRGTPMRSRVLELIFDALEADLAQGSPAGALVGESLIAAAFAHLTGLSERTAACTLSAPARDRVVQFIEAHFDQPLMLADLAAVAGVGVRQFCRAFRASTGESPHQFLLRRRVEHAQAQIARGLPLAEVAQSAGFTDQSQLTRTFARHFGTTPGRYRAQFHR